MRRQSGVLLHISSLPSRYGIGTLGKAAYDFVDFLKDAGQSMWQILPLGPTGYGDSPYQSFSTFAGNPYFIDLEMLVEEGLLLQEEISDQGPLGYIEKVDYGLLFNTRMKLLSKAAQRGYGKYGEEEQQFYAENADWLPDYALYRALKNYFPEKAYWNWPEDIRDREPEAMEKYSELLKAEVEETFFIQYLFDCQWKKLKAYAAKNNIEIIGDLPIYVATDSADAWSHPELFMLDARKRPTEVAGVPPDAFSDDGQLWGNPIYNWPKHKENDYAWWTRRLAKAVERHDLVRIDHFRGFAGYYSIPGDSETAKNGEWKVGPGLDLFETLKKHISMDSLIAEDLGVLDDPVRELLKGTGLPGMKVMLFAFGGDDSEYLCHNYTYNSIAYIGTHDNETLTGWIFNPKTLPECRQNAVNYMRLRESEGYNWGAIRTLMASVSRRVVFQMQDILGLSNYARMNTPSSAMGNWQWRVRPDVFTKELSAKLKKCTDTYHRN